MKVTDIVDYSNPNSLGNRTRQKRFEFFTNCIKDLPRPIRILDIGGTESFWINRGFANNVNYQLVLINLHKEESDASNIVGLIGDATDLSQYEDNTFDVVFSNSVIEHLFNFENQQKMAAETIRVGKRHFIQTPNKYFLIEPHFLFPLFQFLPDVLKLFLLTRTTIIRGKKFDPKIAKSKVKEIQLLSRRDLNKLFPNSKTYTEYLFGLKKSFIMHNF